MRSLIKLKENLNYGSSEGQSGKLLLLIFKFKLYSRFNPMFDLIETSHCADLHNFLSALVCRPASILVFFSI